VLGPAHLAGPNADGLIGWPSPCPVTDAQLPSISGAHDIAGSQWPGRASNLAMATVALLFADRL